MIHKYKLNGYNIVLDVHSGGVHVVDDLSYDMLDELSTPMVEVCPESLYEKFSQYPKEHVAETYNELYGLYQEGILFSEDDYEQFSDILTSSPIKAMCLHVAHDCNLRCKYCFASTGDFGQGRKLMPAETGKKAIDFLIGTLSGTRHNIELDFFGGEPLMNFDVVKASSSLCQSQRKRIQ